MENFLLLILLASCVCIGINIITSGREVIKPDGSKVYEGKLLCFVSKYFGQYSLNKVYLQDTLDVVARINYYFKYERKSSLFLFSDDNVAILEKSKHRFSNKENLKMFELDVESRFGFKVDSIELDDRYEFRFYFEDKSYRFSDYLRDPLYNCPPCMSSLWGVPIYIISWCVGFIDFGGFWYNLLMLIPFLLILVCVNNFNKKINS